ncbi:MAG: acylphosphatase [Lachnospiraceae bacterium]|nr:acylphosphatase [Lachnospiraceae bacterium]
MIRKHIIFYGRVQGVGFRYRAGMGAHEAGGTGWARNEYDGSVSMEMKEIPVKNGEKGFGVY